VEIAALITKMKDNILLIPEGRFDTLTRDKGYADSFIYLLVTVLMTIPFYIAMQFLGPVIGIASGESAVAAGFGLVISIATVIGVRLLSVVFSYIGFGIMHILLKLVGGKADFLKTVQVMIYGSTPSLLLSWIPCIGWIFGLIGLINIILGAKRVHGISLLRAIVAMLVIPILIAGVVAVLIVLFFGFTLAGITQLVPSA